MNINRKLIRANFLKMLGDDKKEKERQQQQEEEAKLELINQKYELHLMSQEEDLQNRIAFYKKMGVNKPDMYIEYLYACRNDNYDDFDNDLKFT
jgi:hypothetical protein